jgi:hypothetical protein
MTLQTGMQAGVLKPAVSFLLASCQPAPGSSQGSPHFTLVDSASAKLGCWLLGNLTAGLGGGPCGPEVMAVPGLLPCVVSLLDSSATPGR